MITYDIHTKQNNAVYISYCSFMGSDIDDFDIIPAMRTLLHFVLSFSDAADFFNVEIRSCNF